jgi:type II secretory pathway pseudopilin PulG
MFGIGTGEIVIVGILAAVAIAVLARQSNRKK